MEPAAPLNLPSHYPLLCQWEITCRCNLHCVMCYTDRFNTPERIRRELSTPQILSILDELADAGCLELVLTGGEPIARPDFFEIYSHAKKKGLLVTVFTNATLIDEKAADRFAADPPLSIEISFHGLTERSFEAITQGKGSFDRCRRAIGLLLERKVPVVLKTLAMTVNREEVLAIKRFAEDLGVGYRIGEELLSGLDGDPTPLRYQLSDGELDAMERGDDRVRNEACCRSQERDVPCSSDRRRFHIDAYGMLQRCSCNRLEGYDLLKGSFAEGFYGHLRDFPCPYKCAEVGS